MKKIKTLIARTIKNLGKLTAFALLVIPAFAICCLLGSWTTYYQTPYGQVLKSDNLVDQDNFYRNTTLINHVTITKEINTLYITTNVTTDNNITPYVYFNNVFTPTEGGTYTMSLNIDGSEINVLGWTTNSSTSPGWVNGYNNAMNYHTATLNGGDTYGFGIHFNQGQPNKTFQITFMVTSGNTYRNYEPYGTFVYTETYDSLYNNYTELNNDYNTLDQNYNTLQNNYNDLLQQYNDLLNSRSIDYDNYTIKLINYTNSNTLNDNYTVIQTIQNTSNYVNQQGFLDINALRQIQGFGNTWDGILIESENELNIYNYNLLFNGTGNPNLDFALYYTYYNNDTFTVLSLNNIVGDSYYYGYFDLITLFGRNNISINNQNVLYNKFAVHWTNIPMDNDLVNIKLNSADGYNSGYAQGQADQLYNVEELTETIEDKERQIQELQTQYDTLLDHYNTAQIDNPLSQMVVSIADIPLNLFHEMFNFDIMGFNLSAFILGIITILLVAYVIKLFL